MHIAESRFETSADHVDVADAQTQHRFNVAMPAGYGAKKQFIA
jgi:hypothetical protein